MAATAVWYLASSSKGVSAHLVVRVVVTALESAPPDTAESRDSTRTPCNHILKCMPGKTVNGDVAWEVVSNEMRNHLNKKIIGKRIFDTEAQESNCTGVI